VKRLDGMKGHRWQPPQSVGAVRGEDVRERVAWQGEPELHVFKF
jgi:hypothetical protein